MGLRRKVPSGYRKERPRCPGWSQMLPDSKPMTRFFPSGPIWAICVRTLVRCSKHGQVEDAHQADDAGDHAVDSEEGHVEPGLAAAGEDGVLGGEQ